MASDESPAWRTAISDPREDTIVVRGYDLTDLLADYDFASIVFLVIQGRLPDDDEAAVFDAIISASIDHGISPSQAVSRFVASAGHTTPAAVAAGVLMWGDDHGGAGEEAARLFETGVDQAIETGKSLDDIAADIVAEYLENGDRIPGFGHPMHPEGDPRARIVLEIAEEHGVAGDAVDLASVIERELIAQTGKDILKMNPESAYSAVLVDMGFDPRFARVRALISRVPALIAHVYEEKDREQPWREVPGGVEYDGSEGRTPPK